MTATITEGLHWIDAQADARRQTLRDWAHINSGSRNLEGLDRMAVAAVAACEPLGADIEYIDLPPQTIVTDVGEVIEQPLGRCIRLTKRPQANRRVLFTGHLDTVFPVDSHFQTCTDLGNGLLGGPGVADMKGGILVMLTALEAFERSELAPALGWEIIFNPDEEIGSPGSAAILTEAAKRAHVGMVYEPAMPDGALAGARKGSGNFSLIVKGKAAHAGREHHLGRNAVVHLSKILVALDALNGQRDEVTFNAGRFSGGGPVNVVPDTAMATFNIRVPDEAAMTWAEEAVGQVIKAYSQDADYGVELHGAFGRPPKPMTPDLQRLFDLVAECGAELDVAIHHKPTGGCCDGNNLAAAGLPNVDTLGVRGANIHSDQEYMVLDSLAERAKLSFLLLSKLATGPWTFEREGV